MQILLHLGKKGSQCSQIPTIGLQGLAITLHTKLRKQGFNPHCHIQIWYPPKPLHGMQSEIKVASVLLVGYISISCILTLWDQMFPAFPLTFPAISPATETGPPNSSLHSFSSLTVIHRLSDICGGYSNLLIDGKTNHY